MVDVAQSTGGIKIIQIFWIILLIIILIYISIIMIRINILLLVFHKENHIVINMGKISVGKVMCH